MKLKTLGLALAAGVLVSTAPSAMAEIRIGAFTSATGPASFLGEPQRLTIEMLVKEINEAGGINGESIRIFYYDDMSDASASRNFATRMIEEDEVVAVIGGSGTGNSMAVIPVVEDAEIPFVSFSGGVEIIEPVREWVFKPPHTDRMACEKIFEDMKTLGLSRAALISGQGGFAQSMAKQCSELAPKVGVTILAQESYGPRDSDMTPQLNRIRAVDGVEAVINADVGQGPAIVTRNFRQLGMEQTLYMSHAAATQGYFLARSRLWESAALLLVAFTLFRPGFWMDMIEPEYDIRPSSELMEIVEAKPANDFVRLRAEGFDALGREVSKVVMLNVGAPGSGMERLSCSTSPATVE